MKGFCSMSFRIQNASMTNRIAAFVLDFILLLIVATGLMLAVSAITDFDGRVDELKKYYEDYAAEYGVASLDITEEEYNSLSKEEQDKVQDAMDALNRDEGAKKTFSMISNLTLLIPSLGIFAAYMLLEFAVPLFLKNGQTVGKKIFGLGVIRIDGVKPSAVMLFARTLLGKFTVETMIPLMFVLMNGVFGLAGLTVVGLILIFNICLLIFNSRRMVIHDAFAQTVVVDLKTQLVFNNAEELLEYKTRIAAEQAEKAQY